MFELVPFDYQIRHAIPYNPFKELDEYIKNSPRNLMAATFNTDIIDNGESFELNAELPGFSKENIKLDVENDCLIISAERNLEENEENKNFVKRERYYGSFSRSYDLTGIDIDKIEADYNNGVLSIHLPKLPEEAPLAKSITIK